MKGDEQKPIVMKTVRLPSKRIDERSSEVIESIIFWIDEGFDGVVFDRCFCGLDCGHRSAYYLKCGHSDVEGHFSKVYNDYCPVCLSKSLRYIA